jgi:hypothetical protein
VTRTASDEAADLAVLAVTPGSRVVLFGATPALTAALADRGCRLDDEGDALDAVIVHGGSVTSEGLAEATTRLAAGGRVVVTAANVTHGAMRLALLQGRFPTAGEGPVFDRTALDRLFTDAGLVVIDRVEVRRPLDEAGVDVDLDAFKPELLAALGDDPDAEVAALVFVGRRASDDTAANVGNAGTDGLSLAEELQDRLRRAELEAARARSDADARGERVRELEEALRARMAELDDLHGELAHARMDLELKDAYSLEMRTLADDREVQAHHTRLEAQALQRSVDHLQASLLEAHALLASRTGELAVARVEMNQVATELDAVLNRATYQIVDGTTKAFERFRPAARLAKGVARRLARLAGRGGPTPPATPGA